jgi:hypothetical protein
MREFSLDFAIVWTKNGKSRCRSSGLWRRVDLGRHQHFEETYSLHLHGWRQYVPPKRWPLPTSPHGVTTQKTNIDVFTAVRTSNFVYCNTTFRKLVVSVFV